jgi:hypothetical protein
VSSLEVVLIIVIIASGSVWTLWCLVLIAAGLGRCSRRMVIADTSTAAAADGGIMLSCACLRVRVCRD